jgi:hypothetical protein
MYICIVRGEIDLNNYIRIYDNMIIPLNYTINCINVFTIELNLTLLHCYSEKKTIFIVSTDNNNINY